MSASLLVRVPTIETAGEAGIETPTVFRVGRLGPVGISDMTVKGDWVLACDDVGAQYSLHLPVTGTYHLTQQGRDIWSDRRTTAVQRPETGPVLMRWTTGYRALCVTFGRATVHDALAAMLGEPPTGPVTFHPTLNTASGRGRDWAALLFSLRRQMETPQGLPAEPLLAEPLVGGLLAEGVVNGFLLATSHSYSAALREPVPTARPAAVRAAVELMEAQPHAPLTVSGVAAHCGVSVRTLQNAFRRHMGMSPLAYLREVRLRRAHQDLRAADPAGVSVADVARRWGFGHLGRFAAAHEAKYGETPSNTLRG